MLFTFTNIVDDNIYTGEFIVSHSADVERWPRMVTTSSYIQKKMSDADKAVRKFKRDGLVDCSVSLYGIAEKQALDEKTRMNKLVTSGPLIPLLVLTTAFANPHGDSLASLPIRQTINVIS